MDKNITNYKPKILEKEESLESTIRRKITEDKIKLDGIIELTELMIEHLPKHYQWENVENFPREEYQTQICQLINQMMLCYGSRTDIEIYDKRKIRTLNGMVSLPPR